MSSIIVAEGAQPDNKAFASIPSSDELAAQQNAVAEPKDPVEPVVTEDDGIPDKFKGKSKVEIAESYSNLESELGRVRNEVGSLRGLTDQLLEIKRTEDLTNNGGSPDPTTVTGDDLLSNPHETITAVAQEATSQTDSRVDQLEHSLAMRDFAAKHSTFQEDMADPDFIAWAQSSPYRQNLAAKTLNQDLGAADELFTAWDEVKAAKATASSSEQDLNAATSDVNQQELESATAIAARGGESVGEQPAKAISRQELMKIRIEDPDRYYDPAFQEYMMDMYRKKLVK